MWKFVRLGAMIKSVVGLCDHWNSHLKLSHVGSMRPVICILLVVCDGSMWEPVLNTQLSMYLYLSHVFCELKKIAKMSLIANGLNVFHVYTHVLHAICDGMVLTQL